MVISGQKTNIVCWRMYRAASDFAQGFWIVAVSCNLLMHTGHTPYRDEVIGSWIFFLNLIPWDGDWTSPCNHTLHLQVHSIELAYRCHCVTYPTQDNKDPECSAQRGQWFTGFLHALFLFISVISAVLGVKHTWILCICMYTKG